MPGFEGQLSQVTLKKVCVLLSGGLDSSVLVSELANHVEHLIPVYVRSGLSWEDVEWHWIQQFLSAISRDEIQPLKEIALPLQDVYDSHWSTTGDAVPDHLSTDNAVYLPGRNLMLLVKTSLFCALNQIPAIALGLLKGNPFPDSTPHFLTAFGELVKDAVPFELQIITPFGGLSKSQVIALGKHLPLHLTFSCISPVGLLHCGACNKCAERRRSFLEADVEDKTFYHAAPTLPTK